MTADPIAAALARMRERVAQATEGPWFWPHDNALVSGTDPDGEWTLVAAIHDAGPVTDADAAFIAAARADVPRLLATLEAVLAECDLAQREFYANNALGESARVLIAVNPERIRRAIAEKLGVGDGG